MKYGLACAVGETPSSSGLPSLATVCERLRPMWGRNLDWRKLVLESFLGVPGPSSECLRSLLSPLLFMRKKFLIFCETWLLEPFTCLFDDRGRPEKVRFSDNVDEFDELKSCVMAVGEGGCWHYRRRLSRTEEDRADMSRAADQRAMAGLADVVGAQGRSPTAGGRRALDWDVCCAAVKESLEGQRRWGGCGGMRCLGAVVLAQSKAEEKAEEAGVEFLCKAVTAAKRSGE